MTEIQHENRSGKEPKVRVAGGRVYFSREAERRCFFILTLLMMAAGVLYKLGVF